MWLHPTTQANVAELKARGVTIVEPESGWLAEGEVGWGRLAEPEQVVAATLALARRTRQLAGKRIVVTAGPTREAIDPVRYISNRSSGKMGFAIANACAWRGAEVTLIAGPVGQPTPYGVRRIDVETAEQMHQAVNEARDGAEALFMAAAVSDYVPRPQSSKIKKSGDALTLELPQGPDILAALGRDRRERILVGFAAETEKLLESAAEKLERKNADYIVANDISAPDVGMDADENAVTILKRGGGAHEVPRASKAEVAEAILDRIFGSGGDEIPT
jgi:phosphopantothenoylcysteine decarboxylase/phosphopantothenate--cysteine ligase